MNRWKDRRADADTAADPSEDVESGEGTGDGREPSAEAGAGPGADAAGDPGTNPGSAADAGSTADPAAGAGTELADDASSVERELADLRDRHLRLAAEFENFRKRTRKEASAGRTMAQAQLVQQILPTLDDLARVADTPHETTTVQALDEGIELILRNLRKQLADAGLERIDALDERFDPERHQAVTAIAASDPELDETISRVFVDGYEFLGRLVRPAQVEVRRYEEPAAGVDAE